MLSIGRFAEMAQVSARTVRYYESIGLLPKSSRGENNYRFYDHKWLERMNRIRELQNLGFSLEDIKEIIGFSVLELNDRLKARLVEINKEVSNLEERRERIKILLSVANKIETGESLTETERKLFMENIKEEVIKGIKSQNCEVTDSTLAYLERDIWIHNDPRVGEFIEGVKKCFDFAKQQNLKLGTARGSASASLSLFGLGISGIDPMKHDMIPERLSTQMPSLHIDVEFERGQVFVDFCKDITKTLPYGEIQAFKMPLMDIIQNVHAAIGHEIDYDAIDDDSDVVLNHFRKADIEKIFQFDFSEDALVMHYENFLPEYNGLSKYTDFLKNQKVHSFRDVINMTALWRPNAPEMVSRIERYKNAKSEGFSYEFLSEKIKNRLKPNFGVVLYHEDLISIISEYTGWDFARSNLLRRVCLNAREGSEKAKQRDQNPEWIEFTKLVPKEISDLVLEESKWAFCLPHAISFAKFTKQTAVLKSLHKDIYYVEIERFEQKHGFTWDDIGIKIKGVSLHQG